MVYTPRRRSSDDDDDDEELDQPSNTEQAASTSANTDAHTTRQQQQHVDSNIHTAIPRPASGSTINPSVPMEPSSTQPNIRIHNPDLLIHNIWTTWTFNR
jgi:hypothetical protein